MQRHQRVSWRLLLQQQGNCGQQLLLLLLAMRARQTPQSGWQHQQRLLMWQHSRQTPLRIIHCPSSSSASSQSYRVLNPQLHQQTQQGLWQQQQHIQQGLMSASAAA